MKRRIAIIMAADVVNYSLMMGEDEIATVDMIRELREEHFEPAVLQHGGEVLKRMGDGWIIAFNSVSECVECAVNVQTALKDHPTIKLRIGIHMGDILEDSVDFYGAGINIAARLQNEAPPTGLLISADIHRQLSSSVAAIFSDAGKFRLKNITQIVNGYQWRPIDAASVQTIDDIPIISVEPFTAVPDSSDARSAATDLREQLIAATSRRTGVRLRDAELGDVRDTTYLLRGFLRLSDTRARFNLTMLMCSDGSAVWSNVFDGDASDLFGFCDDVALRADVQLRQQFNALDGMRVDKLPDEALSVSELKARAASSFYLGTIQSWERSQKLMERALRLSPEDHMAGVMHTAAVMFVRNARFETFDDQEMAMHNSRLNAAIENAPRTDFFVMMRALFRAFVVRDADAALSDVDRCLRINPSYSLIHEAAGGAHMLSGRFREAADEFGTLAESLPDDPLVQYRTYFLAVAQFCGGDHSEADETLFNLIDRWPEIRAYHILRGLVLRQLGDDEGAKSAEEAAARLPAVAHFHTPRPNLSADWDWLIDALAPSPEPV
ncbi:MAG: hypothetical protein GY789_10610 [Hyphomicrobiales bacterium]|nr:hypothetical protein [Hyphomicrobiales bacterium]